jgi:iron(II)-dependent oxidoreductase
MMGTGNPEDLDPPSWAKKELESEQPQHEVSLTSGYWIDKYEVTYAAFQAFADAGGYEDQDHWSPEGWTWREKQGKVPVDCGDHEPNHPRACVTWYEAEAYARWRGGRLPTEAEWEYAARGPQSLTYPWGDSFDPAKANVVKIYDSTPVGSYPEGISWVGAHDMAGNVSEWVQDWLDEDYYRQNVQYDPQGPETGEIKVEKGGPWGTWPYLARCAYRHFTDPPTYQDAHIGFRIVTPAESGD